MCQNIELFDEYTARVFSRLYQSFPVKQTIDILEFFELGVPDKYQPGFVLNIKGERDIFSEQNAKLAWHTLIFLKENGFVSIGRESPYTYFSDVTLTIKGLNVLQAEPDSIKPAKRIGNEIIGALNTGRLEAAKALVRQAIRLSLGV